MSTSWFEIGDWLALATGFMTTMTNNTLGPFVLEVDTQECPIGLELDPEPLAIADLVLDPEPVSLVITME